MELSKEINVGNTKTMSGDPNFVGGIKEISQRQFDELAKAITAELDMSE